MKRNKPTKLKRLKFEPTNLTDYNTSQGRNAINKQYDQDTRGAVNLLAKQNISINSSDKNKRLIPNRDNSNRTSKGLSLKKSRKIHSKETSEDKQNPVPVPLKGNFMKLALQEVQKSARNEGPSTGRKSIKNQKETGNIQNSCNKSSSKSLKSSRRSLHKKSLRSIK